MRVVVCNSHRHRRAHPREAEHQNADQRPVALADERREVDPIQEPPRLLRGEHRRLALFYENTGISTRVAGRYNSGYTLFMKTAISIQDKIFEAAERTAAVMGISRSELYTKAVEEFVSRHSGERITEKLDALYGDTVSASTLDGNLENLQFLSLPVDDEW